MASFALLYYLWELTRNATLVGAVGIVQVVPLLIFGLIGGTLADRYDRRVLVLITRCGQMTASVAMAIAAISGTRMIVVFYLIIGIQSALDAVGAPASKSFTARLLPKDQLSAGFAVTGLAGQASLLGGPLIAGLVIAGWGVNVCFVFDACTFVGALYGVARLPSMTVAESAEDSVTQGIPGALRFISTKPILIGAFMIDLAATVLAMPISLFPVINAQRFGGSPVTLGLMVPALGVGGLIAGMLSGRVTRSPRPGVVMLWAGAFWAIGLLAFGAVGNLWIALAALVCAGAADTISVLSRTTIVQHVTPDAYRGRVNAVDYLVGAGGPQLGNFRAGLVASATSGAVGMVIGGITSLIGVLLVAGFNPAVRRYRDSDSQLTESA